MREKTAEKPFMIVKRDAFLEKGYELFVAKTIQAVSVQDVAKASGYGVATLYRYFPSKPIFTVAVATWKWKQFQEENKKRRPSRDFVGMTASEIFEFYLDSFLELYRKHRDLLRFNQFFNVYIQAEQVDAETIGPYQEIIGNLREQFRDMYRKAEQDHTLRTDIPEEEMFSTTLHLMLAAVTRYAVGLVYVPEKGFDAMRELQVLKEALLWKYTNTG
jgi:AcrR family transcriptional regulator